MDWFWEWLKQPSSLRALNVLLGAVGISLAPDMWESILAGMAAIWVIVDGFYNRQPAKPEE